jgi:tRNA G18 (ribose-2'-O)-methylase SpoU
VAIVVPVADPDDPRLAPYVGLTDAARREALEAREGIFIVEGKTAIRRLLSSPYSVRSLLVTPVVRASLADAVEAIDVEVLEAPLDILRIVTGFDIHRGALAAAGRLPLPDVAPLLDGARTVVVLEGLNDHENIGAVARTARALGADALLLDPTCADPLYRRAVRVSMGEILHLPYTRLTPWPASLDRLRGAGFVVVALTPGPGADAIDELAEHPPERLALLLGSEATGLSAAALAAADHRVRITQRLDVDSLNVGHACAIALHRLGPRHL